MGRIEVQIENLLNEAKASDNGRKAKLMVSDGPLRQTVIGLTKGTTLQEHNSPPAASIFVLKGQITVTAQDEDTYEEGDLAALTHYRHSVTAVEDSVFLLTTVTSVPGQESHGDQSAQYVV